MYLEAHLWLLYFFLSLYSGCVVQLVEKRCANDIIKMSYGPDIKHIPVFLSTFTFTFRSFSRRYFPKRCTFVRRKRNNNISTPVH